MMRNGFLDTNVLIDALIETDSDHYSRAVQLLESVADGEVVLHVSSTVILEAAYVLTGRYHVPRVDIASRLRDLLSLANVVAMDEAAIRTALQLWQREPPLSFADCYHLVLARSLGLDAIYSFDRKMGRYPGVERLEP